MKSPHVQTVAVIIGSLILGACAGSREGSEGNIVEKMAIFTLISLSAFALVAISFSGRKKGRAFPPADRENDDADAAPPFTVTDLCGCPVYARDPSGSFSKRVFGRDGTLLESSAVAANGIDPPVTPVGTWELTLNGKVTVTPAGTGGATTYSRGVQDEDTASVRVQLDSGGVETWYMGPHGLAAVQLACFGNHASGPHPGDTRE